MHNNIMAAGSKDRPPMLGPGRYSQWRSRFLRYLDTKSNGEYLRKCIFEGPYTPTSVLIAAVEAAENIPPVAAHEEAETIHNMTTENKLYFQAEKEAIFLILTGIGDEIYSTVDACNTAKEMWTAIERLQQGESLNVQDVKTNLFWEFGKFTSRDGESMESYYSRFYKLMNELTRNNLQVSPMQVNVQFLQQLQPEWSRFVTVVKQREEIDTVSYHRLFDVLKQFQNEVNDIRSERLARSANPLALLAAAQPYSDNYYQAPKPQRSNAPSYMQSSSTRPSASTRHKGKEIAKPVTPQSESVSEEDSDPEQARRDKDMAKEFGTPFKVFQEALQTYHNNLRTSLKSREQDEETTPRHSGSAQMGYNALTARDLATMPKECKCKALIDYTYQGKDDGIHGKDLRRSYLKYPVLLICHWNRKTKTILKQLKKANASLTQELKECRTNLDETGVNHSTSVSRPPLKSYQVKDKVMLNNSQVKFTKKEVEDHHRISTISKKTKSVIVCNNTTNSRSLNVNVVCAECGKCVLNSNHDACVSRYLNVVNARTKKPNVVPIGTSFNGQKQQRIDLNADALYNAKQENLRVWLQKMLISKKPVPECSGLVLHQMTSAHNRSELGIHVHNNEPSSSKLVPKVVPLAVKTATSRQELELLFHHHIAMLRTTELELCSRTNFSMMENDIECASFFLVKLAMSPFPPKKFRMGVAIATGRRGYYKPGTRAWVSRISRKIRIPISMYPCRVEERLTIELAEGREVEKIVTTVTKNGVVTRYPGKFHEYQLTDKEKEIERMMIYWEQVEYEVSDEDDSDLESTARSVHKDYELEDTGDSSGI
ncbi:hypothetical protein Tco_1494163 [Tanacetum coccineum]